MSRIVAVTPWFPSEKKPAAGVFNLRDAQLLAASHEVTVVHLAESRDRFPDEPSQRRLDSGIEVIQVPYRQLDPVSALAARRVVRDQLASADFVHTMAAHALLPVRLATPRVPWVHTEHWSVLIGSRLALRKRIAKQVYAPLLKHPDAAVAVGGALAAAVDAYRSERTRIIDNWVAQAQPGSGTPVAPESRGDSPLRLVSIGNLIERKGPKQSIDAVAELQRRGVSAILTWLGSGELREEAEQHARRLGIADRIDFVGVVPPEGVPGYLRDAHLFIAATSSETFGVAIAEALGHGLPVVASGSGGHVEFLPPEASRIVSRRDGESFADAIEALCADPARWSAEQIMGYAAERFSPRRREEAYREVYAAAAERFAR